MLAELWEHGRVQIPYGSLEGDSDPQRVRAVLSEFEKCARLEFPGEPPEFDPDAAAWAAESLFQVCRLAVIRDLEVDQELQKVLATPPTPADASSHYSVDLVFRFLPDVLRLARALAEGDPLVAVIRTWCANWPLSSVGVAGLEVVQIEPLLRHAGLRTQYVDRILAHGDASRMTDERVRDAVRQAIGVHESLVRKEILDALSSPPTMEQTVSADSLLESVRGAQT